jgi:hypothetical protein
VPITTQRDSGAFELQTKPRPVCYGPVGAFALEPMTPFWEYEPGKWLNADCVAAVEIHETERATHQDLRLPRKRTEYALTLILLPGLPHELPSRSRGRIGFEMPFELLEFNTRFFCRLFQISGNSSF